MRLKRILAFFFALTMVFAALPALATGEGGAAAPASPTAPGPSATEITMTDANSGYGVAYILVSISNNSSEAITLTDVTCTSKRVIKDAVLLPNNNAPIAIASGDSYQFILSKGVASSVTGSVTETFDFTFTSVTTPIFKKSSSVSLTFAEATPSATPAPGTSSPAFRLSAYDKAGKFVNTPSGNAGDKVTVRIPLVCIDGPVDHVTVTPKLSTNLDEFPFDITLLDYTLAYDSSVKQGEIIECQYVDLRIGKKVTSGVKKVDFTVSYVPRWGSTDAPQTQDVSIYVNVVKGYTEATGGDTPTAVSQPKVILESYSMSTDKIYAGEEFEVTFTLKNTSTAEAVQNIQISISDTSDTGKLLPAQNGSNTLYIQRIDKDSSYTVKYAMQSAADIEPKAYKLALAIAYEGAKKVAAYTANETISVTILQKIRLKFDDPVFYDDCLVGSPCGVSLAMYNMGRSSVYNCMVAVEGDGLAMEETYFGGTVTSGGTMSADFSIIASTAGDISGAFVVSYEDSLGEAMEERIPFTLSVQDMSYEEPVLNDPSMNVDPTAEAGAGVSGGLPVWAWIAIGVGVLGCAAVVLLVIRRKKHSKELEDV